LNWNIAMFRKLTEADRHIALAFLSQEPAYNVFAIGDIEHYGFDADFQDVWGEIAEDGSMRSLVLRYHGNYIVYSPDDAFDIEPARRILKSDEKSWNLSGKRRIMDRLCPALGLSEMRRQTLSVLNGDADLPPLPSETDVEWITAEAFDEVAALRNKIPEFKAFQGATDALRHNLETGAARTNIVRRNGKPVASASSAAENTKSAMIIGVCTEESHRKQGFASACVTRLCRTLLNEGKVACLFYDNPAAASIYKRIGFRDVGRWAMAHRGAP